MDIQHPDDDAALPAVAEGGDPHPRRRGRTVAWWLSAVGAVAVIAGILTWVHISANRSFDEASADLSSAAAEVDEERAALDEPVDDANAAVEASGAIVGAAADDLVDVTARAAMVDAAAAASAAVAAIDDLAEESVPTPPDKPAWTWELLGVVPALEASSAELEELSADTRSAGDDLERADAALVAAAGTLYASVPSAAAALEAANVSARNIVVLDFRDASAAAAQQTMLGSGAITAFADYAHKAVVLKESAQSELAEKAGPLLATRLEIEAFARSIAGGVVLDFDWAPIVNGLGGAEGMAGTATWNTVRGGFSTITLSDSVAENWPSADAQALVAHEVGHSITSKCSDMFDSDSRIANEQWATAWAIGMGHTAWGNGVQAYGYPPAEMIEIARGCR